MLDEIKKGLIATDKATGKEYPVTALHFFYGGELTGVSIDTGDGEMQDMPAENYTLRANL